MASAEASVGSCQPFLAASTTLAYLKDIVAAATL